MTLFVYVDDVLLASNNLNVIQALKKFLDKQFTIQGLGELKYIIGFEIARSQQGTNLYQIKYALNILEDSSFFGWKLVAFSIDSTLKLKPEDYNFLYDPSVCRRLISKLIYLTITRPDLSYSIQLLSQFMFEHVQSHLDTAYRVPSYIKATSGQGLFFSATQTCILELTVTVIGLVAFVLGVASLSLPFSLISP